MKLIFGILLFVLSSNFTFANNVNNVLDNKIKKFCTTHKGSHYYNFGKNNGNNGLRCTKILQAIYRFETGNLKSYTGNNIFNFRSPTCKPSWEKYGCGIKNGFLTFPDKTKAIQFAVDRYYKYDVYKNIKQIIAGGYYCSPVTGWCGYISGYTHTIEDQKNYIRYVKKYFNS